MKSLCENYKFASPVKQRKFYKDPGSPTFIDLILSHVPGNFQITHVPGNFQITCVIETRLSDFNLMTLTVVKRSFKKFKPRIVNFRSYKIFSNEFF